MQRILITEEIIGSRLEQLKDEFDVTYDADIGRDRPRLLAAVADYDALIVRNHTQVDQELMDAATKLKVVGRHGIGLDNVDLEAAERAGVIVTFAPDQNTVSVAELTMGMLLSLARDIVSANERTKAGHWERARFTGIEIFGKTLGIVGLGKIGFRVAMRARAFGMRILAHDKYLSPDCFNYTESGAVRSSLDEVLSQSDFVSCHLPLTDTTFHYFGYEQFSKMKESAFFINLARGRLVDETGLLKALNENQLAGAALDVRETEPPGVDEFSKMDNVILSPHMAGLTVECIERVCNAVCEDVARVLGGLEPLYPAVEEWG